MDNFWYFILDGVFNVINTIIASFPLAQSFTIFDVIPTALADIMRVGIYWVAPFVDLRLLFVAISIVLVLEIVRGAYAIIRIIAKIKQVIPMLG